MILMVRKSEQEQVLELVCAAERGSRELDGRIFLLSNPDTTCVIITRVGWVVVDEHVPRYTTSIDAALKLASPRPSGGNLAGFLHACMWQSGLGDIPDERMALAICERVLLKLEVA